MGWTEGDIEAGGGARIHYYRRGSGPPLILAHGATDDGRCWGRVAERLEDGYDLIAYDARGHGKSADSSPGQPSPGEDLLALAAALGLDRPAAMGHSMGAGAVADAASRAPDALRAAILEDPGWRGAPMPAPPAASDASSASKERARTLTGWVEGLQKLSLEEVIAAGRKSMPTWHEDELPAWAESKLRFRPPPPRERDRDDDGPRPPRPDWREQAAAITVPLLLLRGDPTKALVDDEGAAEAQRLCPTCEVVQFDTGHNIRREDFDGFVATVRAFLDRVHAGVEA
jgi:pimeloyl-ACP methyl ester carboxylesterase